MNNEQFIEQVRMMRAAQTSYFRHRSQENLVAAKMLEKSVDDAVKRLQEVP